MERIKKGLRCQIGSLLLIEKVTTKLLVIEKESFFSARSLLSTNISDNFAWLGVKNQIQTVQRCITTLWLMCKPIIVIGLMDFMFPMNNAPFIGKHIYKSGYVPCKPISPT